MKAITLEKPTHDFKEGPIEVPSIGGWTGAWTDTATKRYNDDFRSAESVWEAQVLSLTSNSWAEILDFASLTHKRTVKIRLQNRVQDAYNQLITRIECIAARQPGWDGDEGVAPSASAVQEAKAFLGYLKIHAGLPQTVYSPGDGEINFEWRASRRFTEVGFNGDKTISWFHRDGRGEQFGDEDFEPARVENHTNLLRVLGIVDDPAK